MKQITKQLLVNMINKDFMIKLQETQKKREERAKQLGPSEQQMEVSERAAGSGQAQQKPQLQSHGSVRRIWKASDVQ